MKPSAGKEAKKMLHEENVGGGSAGWQGGGGGGGPGGAESGLPTFHKQGWRAHVHIRPRQVLQVLLGSKVMAVNACHSHFGELP